MIVAALLPLSLRDALAHLPDLIARLEPTGAAAERLQIPIFRRALRAKARERPRKIY
jgi:hypothetical protein